MDVNGKFTEVNIRITKMDFNMSIMPSTLTQNFLTKVSFNQGSFTTTEGFLVYCVFNGPTNATVNAIEEGDRYVLPITLNVSGLFNYTVVAERDEVRTLIESGRVSVGVDPTSVPTGADLRTHPEKLLEAIEAVLEKRATTDQQSYSIAGRSITRIPIAELLQLRDKYKQEVRELRKKAPRAILYRFGSR